MAPKMIVAFDFCGTLVRAQTADDFVVFAIERSRWRKRVYDLGRGLRLGAVLRRFGLDRKRLLLSLMMGMSRCRVESLGQAYAASLDAVANEMVIQRARRLHSMGFALCIVSAGYAVYIKRFLPDLFGLVIANEFRYVGGRFVGCIDGSDCVGQEKLCRIESVFGVSVDLKEAYSDSIVDLPLLRRARCAYVVSQEGSQIWAKEHGFNEILL